MKRSTLLLFAVAALCIAAVNAHDEEEDLAADDAPPAAAAVVDEKDVLVLTTANFNETVAANKYLLVEFYAPWCGHCKTLKAPYAAAATQAKALSPSVAFAKVDATKEEALGTRFNIEGFPTLKFFVDGEAIDYNGGREAADIVHWVKKHSGPPTEVLATDADFTAYVDKANVAVAGFFASKDGDLYQAFQKAAVKSTKPFIEGPVSSATAYTAKAAPTIVLIKKFDEGKAEYDGAADVDAILAWLNENSRPSVIEFKEDQVEEMFNNELPKICLFSADDAAKEHFATAAKNPAVRGKVVMILVPKTADSNFYDFVGVPTTQEKPLIVQLDPTHGKRYRQAEGAEVTVDSIVQFIADVAAGKITAHLKSAAPPATNNGPVIEVVGSTFKELVLDNDKNVIVEFYAPWCGHCQQLAPVYDKTAQHFRESNPDDVVIAKLDGTTNEVDISFNIEGFPTILAFPKGAKDVPIDISNKPRKTAKQFIGAVQKVFKLSSARAGEDTYRDAVDRLKVVLKQKPALLPFVAEELQKVATAAEAKVAAKDEL